MEIPSLKELMSGNVIFDHYDSGELWYEHEYFNFSFPVPIKDADGAVFFRVDKASMFMRWMRPYRQLLIDAQQDMYKDTRNGAGL